MCVNRCGKAWTGVKGFMRQERGCCLMGHIGTGLTKYPGWRLFNCVGRNFLMSGVQQVLVLAPQLTAGGWGVCVWGARSAVTAGRPLVRADLQTHFLTLNPRPHRQGHMCEDPSLHTDFRCILLMHFLTLVEPQTLNPTGKGYVREDLQCYFYRQTSDVMSFPHHLTLSLP